MQKICIFPGKMHIFRIILAFGKCISVEKSLILTVLVEYAFLNLGKYSKNMHFPRENAYFPDTLGSWKMHIKIRKTSKFHFFHPFWGNMQKTCIFPRKMQHFGGHPSSRKCQPENAYSFHCCFQPAGKCILSLVGTVNSVQ